MGSRCQLMGEIARGSWGLCQAKTEDVVCFKAAELWRSAYPRLMVAPQNHMSENYGAQSTEEEEAQRREMRRIAIFRDILRRHRIQYLAPLSDLSAGESPSDDECTDSSESGRDSSARASAAGEA